MNAPRQIEHIALSALKADPRNPKAHSVETIDASVGRFGFVEPIVVDGRTGYIISGHGRTKTITAMYERGESPPEGVVIDAASGEWLVPVVTGWASRTDTEAHAALIALNRTTELGGWVDDALLEMLDELSQVENGFDGVGFSDGDTDDLRRRLATLDEQGLDDLANEWEEDEGDHPSGNSSTGLTIKITAPAVIRSWSEYAEAFDTEDEALAALLPTPTPTTE